MTTYSRFLDLTGGLLLALTVGSAGLLLASTVCSATLTPAELASLNAGGAITLSGPPVVVVVPPPVIVPPPPAVGFTIYQNGVFNWPGDYSYATAAPINYTDTAGKPAGETYDIAVSVTAWGAWQPYATGWDFNRSGLKNLVFKIKPTVGTSYSVQFLKVGDVPVKSAAGALVSVNLGDYCKIAVGVWVTCTVPLDVVLNDKGTVLQNFYKFAVQSHQGTSDLYYIADVYLN